jgi:DnaJ-domain-containing protein 1
VKAFHFAEGKQTSVSIPNRIYRLGKAYLNQVRDRIETWDAQLAEAEKELQRDPGDAASPPPVRDEGSADELMRRAEEKIRRGRTEATARGELARRAEDAAEKASASTDPNISDYVILGVPVGSDWSAVQSAYEKLARRCDPARFPEGSEEQQTARRILERVNAAYESLRKRLDPTQNRFARLEF